MYSWLILVTALIAVMCVVLTLVHDRSQYKVMLGFISVLYVLSVVYFTFFRGERNNLSRISLKLPTHFIRAIQTGKYRAVTHRSLLNLLLFVPYGYLLPQVMIVAVKKTRKAWWQITLCGFLSSLLIETGQFVFRRGVFELDDLLKNTMGTVVGWLIWKVITIITCSNSKKKEGSYADE